ncbi:hypothetical protein BKA62DRAFT_721522, partial [Auriculariales sp. MPI-PUGE-AT-0066]
FSNMKLYLTSVLVTVLGLLQTARAAVYECYTDPTVLQRVWCQCGGFSFSGPTVCAEGAYCKSYGPYYSMCEPIPET